MTSEYRVKVSVRNNLLLSAVEAAGYGDRGGITRFCEAAGVSFADFYALSGMKKSPLTKDGEFSTAARKLMEALGASPSDLWSDEQMTLRLDSNSSEFSVGAAEVGALLEWRGARVVDPEELADQSMRGRAVEKALEALPRRAQQVLRMRFGIGGSGEMSLDECGDSLGVTRERIRQIEGKALRKLREVMANNTDGGAS